MIDTENYDSIFKFVKVSPRILKTFFLDTV